MKYILIFVTGVVLIFCVLFFFVNHFRDTGVPSGNTGTETSPFPQTGSSTIITGTQPTPPVVSDRNQLRDNLEVSVKVFGQLGETWVPLDFNGLVLGTSTDDWQVQYAHEFRMLTIRVSGYPGLQHQQTAEQALTDSLDMTPKEICELGVEVVWNNFETQFTNVSKKLSFCE